MTEKDKEIIELKIVIVGLEEKLKDCRNELCLKCGNYKGKHLGLCKDCRWEQ